MTAPAPADLTTRRRARRVADWLERLRTRVPERRPLVLHARGIVWKQDRDLVGEVLAVKMERELGE